MSTPTLIGALNPDSRFTARSLSWGTEPEPMLDTLRRIWTDTFDRDTTSLIDALLTHDWVALGVAIRPRHRAETLVAGVGLAQPGRLGLRHGVVPGDADGWLEWMYLLDARIDEVAVFEATCHNRWLQHSRHPLAAPAPTPPANRNEPGPLEDEPHTTESWYVVQYQPDETNYWLDKADGEHPTLAAARQYRTFDDVMPLRIVHRTETVIEALPDPHDPEGQ
jgi:hypothetical protein